MRLYLANDSGEILASLDVNPRNDLTAILVGKDEKFEGFEMRTAEAILCGCKMDKAMAIASHGPKSLCLKPFCNMRIIREGQIGFAESKQVIPA